MISPEVQQRIRQLNPWVIKPEDADSLIKQRLPENYVLRKGEAVPAANDRAVLVIGPRQAGKSTLVWHRIKSKAPEILFLNMEDALLRIGLKDPIDFIEHVREIYPFIKIIFLDEVQHMEEAGLFVKALIDAKLGISLWVTGSSSFHLNSRTRESLAGRATRYRLLPFSFTEILENTKAKNPVAASVLEEEIVRHQLVWGSYPAVYLADKTETKNMLLSDLVEALILRDASDIFRIKRIDAFRKLLMLLAGQIGSLVNLSELAAVCNVDVGTVLSYLEILEESHVVKKIIPFAEGKRREITGAPKVYFVDNGIRNQLLNNFSPMTDLRVDRGQLFENWAFTEIYKNIGLSGSIKFWRSKAGAEVDFIIEESGKTMALEVKYASVKQPKIGKSAHSFLDAYKLDQFAILNMNLDTTLQVNGCNVCFLTPRNFASWIVQTLRGK
ncbi:MAG: ATP-binding protein [Deltaproteobacteria bacterium]|nr:ATP-binding protein [Deltaproteobacteria bacterium]